MAAFVSIPKTSRSCSSSRPSARSVRVVNQPFVFGWHEGALHIQAFDVLEDDPRDWKKAQAKLLNKALAERIQKELKARKEKIDWEAVSRLSHEPRGIPVSVSGGPDQLDAHRRQRHRRAEQGCAGRHLGRHLRPAGGRGNLPGARLRSRVVGGVRRGCCRRGADHRSPSPINGTSGDAPFSGNGA